MNLVVERCAGVDIGKHEVVACVRVPGEGGRGRRKETRTFRSFTSQLEEMAAWFATEGVTQVVMEATGSYWKPVWYVLEERGFEQMLVNARHVKILPGRKTDVADAEWLAELLADGEVIPLELAGLDGDVRPLPGGGHVVVGIHPIDGPPPEGFNEMTDMTHGLAVVNAAGEVAIERTIERSALLGVTDREAMLSRQPIDDRGDPTGPVTILAHDLATGDERIVRRGVDVDPDARVEARSAIVGSDLVTVESRRDTVPSDDDGGRIVVPDSAACALRVTDLATGDESERPLDLGCLTIVGLQASPDGRRAAIAYERWAASGPSSAWR